MSNRVTSKDKKKFIKAEKGVEQKGLSSEHLRQAGKKLCKVARNDEDVDSSEDSDQDDAEPPTTPLRAKREKDSCTHDTPASVPFLTPTVLQSPTLPESPKRVKKSTSPSSEVPPFALPTSSNNDAPPPTAIEVEETNSNSPATDAPPLAATKVEETNSNSPSNATIPDAASAVSPAGGDVVGATLVGAVATAAVLAVVASAARQKLDGIVRHCVYVMPGNMKKIWMKNAIPPHHVDVFSTYFVTCAGQIGECTVFGNKASTFLRFFE